MKTQESSSSNLNQNFLKENKHENTRAKQDSSYEKDKEYTQQR